MIIYFTVVTVCIVIVQICEINESPVFLKLNPQARSSEVCLHFAHVSLFF